MKKVFVFNSNKHLQIVSELINSGFNAVVPDLLHFVNEKYPIDRGRFFIYQLQAISECDYIFIFRECEKNDLVVKSGQRYNIPVVSSIEELKKLDGCKPENRRTENRKRSLKHD